MIPMNYKALDPRLSLAFDLYDSCRLAADIGTDHAHLPAALLQRGRCQHMILTDISPSALENAKMEMIRLHLTDRVSLRLGDGLTPVSEPCEMISVMGMGGRTIRNILLSGRKKLQGASLLLSAHTDWHLIRAALQEIGYRLDREEPCLSGGRYYLVLLARPGNPPRRSPVPFLLSRTCPVPPAAEGSSPGTPSRPELRRGSGRARPRASAGGYRLL